MLQNNTLQIGAIKRCMKDILWEIKTGSLGNEKKIRKERQRNSHLNSFASLYLHIWYYKKTLAYYVELCFTLFTCLARVLKLSEGHK